MGRYIKVKVRAGARRNAFFAKAEDAYQIDVKEPAENGRANQAVLTLLSKHLGVPAKKLWIIKGAHAPAKIIEVHI